MTRPLSDAALGHAAEAAVVALAASGDQEAFGELVKRRQSWLRNLLRRLCRDPTLADDLAQQVLLKAWRALPTLKSAASFGPWLRQLAVNTWLQWLRTCEPQHETLAEAQFNASISHGDSETIDLDHALSCLAADVRTCIVLAYAEGLSHGEISATTALPLGTVKSHIKRGSERLRLILRHYRDEENRHVR